MRNSRALIGKTRCVPRDNERVKLIGTRSADHIMASGQSGCNNRPNTWPHPTIAATSNSSCTAGAVHTWHRAGVTNRVDLRSVLWALRNSG